MYLFNSTVLSEKAINGPMHSSLKIGLFGIGLDAYWPQFEGLKERLEGYMAVVEEKIADFHPYIINAGLVDTPNKAFETGQLFKQADVGLIFLYVTTYA
ncbi:MAG: arabinose isomerase, partial [Runella zeae]